MVIYMVAIILLSSSQIRMVNGKYKHPHMNHLTKLTLIYDSRYRFDDDRVTPVTKKEVFEENFGDDPVGTNGSPPFLNGMRNNSARLMKRFTNAYMLVYIRKSQLDEVLGPVVDDDIPLHLSAYIELEFFDSQFTYLPL